MNKLNYQKAFLIANGIILIPIALSYGLMPETSLKILFDIEVNNINLLNMLRSVMGFYLSMVVFWFIGVFNSKLRKPALYSLVVFMMGVASGRTVNILFDGIPHWILIMYTISEYMLGIIGLALLRIKTDLKIINTN